MKNDLYDFFNDTFLYHFPSKKDTQRHPKDPEASRGTKKHPKAPKGTQRHAKALKGTQIRPEAPEAHGVKVYLR